jgi:hypothetical protein
VQNALHAGDGYEGVQGLRGKPEGTATADRGGPGAASASGAIDGIASPWPGVGRGQVVRTVETQSTKVMEWCGRQLLNLTGCSAYPVDASPVREGHLGAAASTHAP